MAGCAEQLVERFTVEVEERLAPSLLHAEREKIISTARQALIASMAALVPGKRAGAALHSWCQWFGCMLDQVIAEQDGRLHGMLYPSRKHRGHDAVAISSRALAALAPLAAISAQPFGGTSACQVLQTDRCCLPPP